MFECGRLNSKSCAACVWKDSSTFEYGAASRLRMIGHRKRINITGDDERKVVAAFIVLLINVGSRDV